MLTNNVPVVEHGLIQIGEDRWVPFVIKEKLENNNYKIRIVPEPGVVLEGIKSGNEIWINT